MLLHSDTLDLISLPTSVYFYAAFLTEKQLNYIQTSANSGFKCMSGILSINIFPSALFVDIKLQLCK
jgi:hypothetical protein